MRPSFVSGQYHQPQLSRCSGGGILAPVAMMQRILACARVNLTVYALSLGSVSSLSGQILQETKQLHPWMQWVRYPDQVWIAFEWLQKCKSTMCTIRSSSVFWFSQPLGFFFYGPPTDTSLMPVVHLRSIVPEAMT